MPAARQRAWLGAALLVGATYLLVGRLFARAGDHVRLWRLAAWLVSGAAFAAHVAYERSRRRAPPRAVAWHAAVAVAVGALGLALVGMLHAWRTTATIRPVWYLALVAWPAVTALPAFVVALLLASVLGTRRGDAAATRQKW